MCYIRWCYARLISIHEPQFGSLQLISETDLIYKLPLTFTMSFFFEFVRNQYTSLPYPTQSFIGQTIIVTGSNTGIGFEAAQHLVRLNAAKVILAVRSISKGEEAARAIAETTGRSDVCEVWELDMASYSSIQQFAKRAEGLERVDVALLNASISKSTFEELNGTESSIAVNVYGTFLLVLNLLPALRKSGKVIGQPSRLTIVTSDAHFFVSLITYSLLKVALGCSLLMNWS